MRATLVSATLSGLLVDGELDGGGGGHGAEVVHAGLQTHLPAGEVHAGELAHGGLLHVDVERLRLIDEGTTVRGHLQMLRWEISQTVLYRALMSVRDVGDVLDRTTLGDDAVLHVVGPETKVDEILQQPRVDDLELTSQHTTGVDVGRVGLEAFVEAQNLTRYWQWAWARPADCCGRRSAAILAFEGGPVPEVSGRRVPHVILQDSLRGRGALVGLIRPEFLGDIHEASSAAW